MWELEVGQAVAPDQGLPEAIGAYGFDDPNTLAAFVDAARWGAATSADGNAFQAPFRSGANVEAYQLEPLRRASIRNCGCARSGTPTGQSTTATPTRWSRRTSRRPSRQRRWCGKRARHHDQDGCSHNVLTRGRSSEAKTFRKGSAAGQARWDGWGSNPRPADYETR